MRFVLNSQLTLPLAILIVCSGCTNSPSPSPSTSASSAAPSAPAQRPYSLPTELRLDAQAQRTGEGAVLVVGTTNFPDGLKMWIEVMEGSRPEATDSNVIIRNGRFASVGLTQKDRPYPPGKYNVRFTAYFNGAWQSRDVLSIVGEGGKNLRAGQLVKLTDRDVVDSDKIVQHVALLQFPPLSEDAVAIATVKHAILTVPGIGRSATNIEENVKLFMSPGTGVRPGKGWSAKSQGNRVYLVSCNFINGTSGEDEAVWSVDLKSKSVKYVNKNAKLFSWTPKD